MSKKKWYYVKVGNELLKMRCKIMPKKEVKKLMQGDELKIGWNIMQPGTAEDFISKIYKFFFTKDEGKKDLDVSTTNKTDEFIEDSDNEEEMPFFCNFTNDDNCASFFGDEDDDTNAKEPVYWKGKIGLNLRIPSLAETVESSDFYYVKQKILFITKSINQRRVLPPLAFALTVRNLDETKNRYNFEYDRLYTSCLRMYQTNTKNLNKLLELSRIDDKPVVKPEFNKNLLTKEAQETMVMLHQHLLFNHSMSRVNESKMKDKNILWFYFPDIFDIPVNDDNGFYMIDCIIKPKGLNSRTCSSMAATLLRSWRRIVMKSTDDSSLVTLTEGIRNGTINDEDVIVGLRLVITNNRIDFIFVDITYLSNDGTTIKIENPLSDDIPQFVLADLSTTRCYISLLDNN